MVSGELLKFSEGSSQIRKYPRIRSSKLEIERNTYYRNLRLFWCRNNTRAIFRSSRIYSQPDRQLRTSNRVLIRELRATFRTSDPACRYLDMTDVTICRAILPFRVPRRSAVDKISKKSKYFIAKYRYLKEQYRYKKLLKSPKNRLDSTNS